MNKKTLAIAALALVVTSGLASAQTVRHQPRQDSIVRSAHNANAAIYPQDGRGANASWAFEPRHPGDNSYDDKAYGSKVGGNS